MAASSHLRHCIEQCTQCHAICVATTQYCLQKGGRHALADHIRLMQDCAQICATSSDFMLRGSPRHERVCAVCAEICEQCADDCGTMADDSRMQQCEETCRRCADACRQMAAAHA